MYRYNPEKCRNTESQNILELERHPSGSLSSTPGPAQNTPRDIICLDGVALMVLSKHFLISVILRFPSVLSAIRNSVWSLLYSRYFPSTNVNCCLPIFLMPEETFLEGGRCPLTLHVKIWCIFPPQMCSFIALHCFTVMSFSVKLV